MTKFIDVSDLVTLVSKVGVETFLQEMHDYIRADFLKWPDFDKCARTAAHSDVGVIELMPVANNERYSFKYVNGHPANTKFGLSTVMAFGALADTETGYPLLLSELTLTTAFRTAATSAMAAKALARPNANIMGMIGCGAQSEFQAIAFKEIVGIQELRIFDIDKEAVQKLKRQLRMVAPTLNVATSDSPEDCVRGADIVTTVTADKAWATIMHPDMVEPGMHINAIGGDCPGKTELHEDVLKAGSIFVEYEPQTRVEGDIQQLPADHPVEALWKVLAGTAQGREREDEVTIFDSVGFALEDYSALRYLLDKATEHNIGSDIELVPKLDDPKNLYALLTARQLTNAIAV
ncbi:ornithine cyclodeaminase [Alteromonas oceanisediminis]|uniref:ornithine cyclodeaminase n=1 Tax=Alteromonas oceanisediminis TaxID=2836180 RepID=UPI001BDA1E7E|nr:ornithine cyclodeaminase [Alteromonas oceanisediminis]MBT0585585.1 ornithine cyclodeaminase [Alteromonas oceanisediminis]